MTGRARTSAVAAAMLDAGVVALSCIVFLALTLYQLELPGVYADEAFDVIPAMQLLLGHPVELQRGVGLRLFGWDLPLMSSSDYQGVTSTYLALPFFAVGGISVASLRAMTVTVGVVGVVLTYFLARAWFGRGTARLAVLLMAVSPAWVFWSRLGVYVVSQVVPIAAGALLALTAWVRRRPFAVRNGPLYAGALLLGLGLTTKLLFLWFIVAVVLTAAILWGRPVWERRRAILAERARWLRVSAISLAWFLLGAGPFILYNILSGGTFNLLRATISSPGTTHGVNNAAVLRNLWTKTDAFKVLLDGSYFWFQAAVDRIYANPLTPLVFVVSALGLIVLLLARRGRSPREDVDRLRTPGRVLTVSLALAGLAALGLLPALLDSLLVILAALGAVAGAGLLVVNVARDRSGPAAPAWLLLGVAALSGALWWLGGSGRPEGLAPGALLGLWPIDGAGAVFWTCAAALVIVLSLDRDPVPWQRPTVAALAIIALVVGQSVITVSGLWSTHLLVLLPLPQVLIAAFAVWIGRVLAPRVSGAWSRAARLAPAVLLVGGIVIFDLLVAFSYHHDTQRTGGRSTFSDAIYSLADYLDLRPDTAQAVALDWGMKRPIQFLTHDRINPLDAYGYEAEPSAETVEGIKRLVAQPGNVFLFRTQEA
ncbi:MAG TPA: glycosyltransferase family 39 protein, partial [Chloroflexia bacterium]|nr:glycosyltransferase family 39 protein [Chloroflexia bacterium]